MGSVKAFSAPPSSATRSSATVYQRLQVRPSSLVRSRTSTAPVPRGGAQVTPAMVNRMPASMVAAPTRATARAPATDGCPTGSVEGRAAERSSTGGVLIHAATASLTRGAAQMPTTAPSTERMEIAARRAARLWG